MEHVGEGRENPIPLFPKTFVFIESLIGDAAVYRMSPAGRRQSLPVPRGGGAAGREGEGGEVQRNRSVFSAKGKIFKPAVGKEPPCRKEYEAARTNVQAASRFGRGPA